MTALRLSALALVGLFALPTAAVAQNCDGTTADMVACGMAALEADDAALNAAYASAIAQADAGGYGEALRTAQRLWIPYRDAACHAEASQYDGGSIQPLIALSCLSRLTQDRTRDLRVFEMP